MGMEKDAAAAMNEDVSLCAVVASRGTGGRVAAATMASQALNIGGAVGSAAAAMGASAAASKGATAFEPGSYHGYMVLAAGKTKLGFFAMKRGLLGNSVGALLGERGREEVSRFAVDGKGIATSAVDIEFKDGSSYALEVPRASKGNAQKLQKELGF
jgi:hypothetical protein